MGISHWVHSIRNPSPEPAADHCLNCGAAVSSAFCPECGQSSATRIVSLRSLAVELFNGLFNYDSKLWATLIPLITRPGFLTNEYIAGRRIRYLGPLQVFLLLTALCFLVFQLTFPFGHKRVGDANQKVILIMSVLAVAMQALFYLRQKRMAIEHAVFSFHFHAVADIALMSGFLLSFAIGRFVRVNPDDVINWVMGLTMPVYYFTAARAVYGQPRWLALIKTAAFIAVYTVLFVIIGRYLKRWSNGG